MFVIVPRVPRDEGSWSSRINKPRQSDIRDHVYAVFTTFTLRAAVSSHVSAVEGNLTQANMNTLPQRRLLIQQH